MDITAEQVIREQTRLEDERRNYEPLKELCTGFAYPDRQDSYELFGLDIGKKQPKTRRVYDPTAVSAFQVWKNGILGNYMPKGVPWFTEQMPNPRLKDSKNVRKWLQSNDEHLRYVVDSSGNGDGCGYYDQQLVLLGDGGCIGDAAMFIDNDDETGKVMCMCPHPRTLWFKRDFWGRITGIHYKFQKTILQLKEEFGGKALTDEQRTRLEKAPDEKVECIYAIYKNSDYQPGKIGVKNMRWRYVYIQSEKKKIMEDSGRDTLNPVPWSLHRPSDWTYGQGIISSMLIEIVTANFMGKDLLQASQQSVNPAMIFAKSLKNKLDLRPGSRNFVEHGALQATKMGDLFSRLIDPSGYPFGIDNHQRWQDMINQRLGVPLFMAMNSDIGPQRTAYEVQQKKAEQAVLMAPFLGTLGTVTDLQLDRIYSIEMEYGRAPEIPQEVLDEGDGRIDIQHIGPLSQLLKMYYESNNLMSTIAYIQQVLSVYPDSAIVVEGDELMRKILRAGNTPEELILSKEDVQEIRAIAAQQQEAQMQAQLLANASKAVPNLSKQIESDSVLDNMRKELAA